MIQIGKHLILTVSWKEGNEKKNVSARNKAKRNFSQFATIGSFVFALRFVPVATVSLQIWLVWCTGCEWVMGVGWQFWLKLSRGHLIGWAAEASHPSSLLGNISTEQTGINAAFMRLKSNFLFFVLLLVRSTERSKTKSIQERTPTASEVTALGVDVPA